MAATATMNGKPQRKQLADQLDRLDSIIDALAEGLPRRGTLGRERRDFGNHQQSRTAGHACTAATARPSHASPVT
ncbi:MAG: hypothetical protein K8U57_11300 [Planctomycetes bacterium]|nr:hypothetical protein [Planctomycetota bacterium]